MSHSLLRRYADAPFEVASPGGSAGAEGARPIYPLPGGGSPGGGREERERAPAMAPQGLKTFSSVRLGKADGKGRREEQGEDLCPGRVIKGKN